MDRYPLEARPLCKANFTQNQQGVVTTRAKTRENKQNFPVTPVLGQSCYMNAQTVNGPYRVREAVRNEKIVPAEVPAFHFRTSVAAHSYARQLASERGRQMVIEKLAPSGCWLQLTTLG
jgi:hypothetical protein